MIDTIHADEETSSNRQKEAGTQGHILIEAASDLAILLLGPA